MVEQRLGQLAGGPVDEVDHAGRQPGIDQHRTISVAASGAFSETRATTVQPAARAGASLRAWMEQGKFHGVRDATTPTGRRMVRCRRSAASWARTSPYGRRACSANQRKYSALNASSPTASGRRLPASRASSSPISSARSAMSRLGSSRMSARRRAAVRPVGERAGRSVGGPAGGLGVPPGERPTTEPSAGLVDLDGAVAVLPGAVDEVDGGDGHGVLLGESE